MPSMEEHIGLSKKRSGSEHREIHEWLDGPGLSCRERVARHLECNLGKYLPQAREKFGEAAVQEYLQHLKDDYSSSMLLRLVNRLTKRRL